MGSTAPGAGGGVERRDAMLEGKEEGMREKKG
jgi:hypothetical protein